MATNMSDMLYDSFTSTGGCYRECACGRVHFTTEKGYDWEDGELEDLQAKAKEDSDKFQEHGESVSSVSIGGTEIVLDCVCDRAERYEKFLRFEAPGIAKYLNRLANNLREEAAGIQVNFTAEDPDPEDSYYVVVGLQELATCRLTDTWDGLMKTAVIGNRGSHPHMFSRLTEQIKRRDYRLLSEHDGRLLLRVETESHG